MELINDFFQKYLFNFYVPKLGWSDLIEIVIIAFIIYSVLNWIKDTRAWTLLKGIIIIVSFALVAIILNLRTILWIASKTFSVGIIAIVIIFQPELRKALEQLGRKKFIKGLNLFESGVNEDGFSKRTVNELVKATFELAKDKTGALIVIENEMSLKEYESTGINIDAVITNQLLVNIFEHNTPLHDGAVIVRGNRVVSATCYLPLSDNMRISKALGTRHRAGLGVSEATDSITIIVSEETGGVTIAEGGELTRAVDGDTLRERLERLVPEENDAKSFKFWKGRTKHEGKDTE